MIAATASDPLRDLERRHRKLRQRFAEFIAVLLMSPAGMQLDGELRRYVLQVAREEGLGS